MKSAHPSLHRKTCLALLVAVLGGCTSPPEQNNGASALFAAGRYEEALFQLEQSATQDPKNLAYRTQIVNRREEAINRLLDVAQTALETSSYDGAKDIYRRILRIDPSHERAHQGLVVLQRLRANSALMAQAREALGQGDLDRAQRLAYAVTEEPANARALAELKRAIGDIQSRETLVSPALSAAFKKPISLEFRDANLKMVFEALSRTTAINFILDREIKADQKTTLFLKQTSLEDAVDMLLVTNQLEKKILNANSILIYPDTPVKIKEYQDLILKTFHLANADVKQILNMVKTLLKTKDVYVDERLNLLVMRDTPEAIRLAEKLIAMQDVPEPEVMLEVEVLEIKRSRLLALGIQYPNQLTLTPLPSSVTNSTIIGPGGATATNPSAGPLTLQDLLSLNANRLGATISPLVANLKKEDGTVNILANPRIRVRNREKARILIGDKVPVITTTSTATGFVAESVQYVDVGLKLDVEPNIYLHNDVAIKVSLEVSNIVRELRSSSGSLSYQIGTRNVSTLLRLKDGETQVLAGLISDESRSSASKIPGIGDLPVLGRLFSNNVDDNQKTEIVLSITPRLVRNLTRPGADEFWSGTDSVLRTRPLALSQPSGALAAASDTPVVTAGETVAPMVSLAATETIAAPNALPIAAPNNTPIGPAAFTWEGPGQVKVGALFRVTLRLQHGTSIGSLPLQFGYDPRAMEIVDVGEGTFFRQGGASGGHFTSKLDTAGGKITVEASSPDTAGSKGEGSVVSLTFKALAPVSAAQVKLLSASGVTTALPGPHAVAISKN